MFSMYLDDVKCRDKFVKRVKLNINHTKNKQTNQVQKTQNKN